MSGDISMFKEDGGVSMEANLDWRKICDTLSTMAESMLPGLGSEHQYGRLIF